MFFACGRAGILPALAQILLHKSPVAALHFGRFREIERLPLAFPRCDGIFSAWQTSPKQPRSPSSSFTPSVKPSKPSSNCSTTRPPSQTASGLPPPSFASNPCPPRQRPSHPRSRLHRIPASNTRECPGIRSPPTRPPRSSTRPPMQESLQPPLQQVRRHARRPCRNVQPDRSSWRSHVLIQCRRSPRRQRRSVQPRRHKITVAEKHDDSVIPPR